MVAALESTLPAWWRWRGQSMGAGYAELRGKLNSRGQGAASRRRVQCDPSPAALAYSLSGPHHQAGNLYPGRRLAEACESAAAVVRRWGPKNGVWNSVAIGGPKIAVVTLWKPTILRILTCSTEPRPRGSGRRLGLGPLPRGRGSVKSCYFLAS